MLSKMRGGASEYTVWVGLFQAQMTTHVNRPSRVLLVWSRESQVKLDEWKQMRKWKKYCRIS